MVSRKKNQKDKFTIKKNDDEGSQINSNLNLSSVKEASKDLVRAIMLIRAYRIRGHLIANLDPLSIQKKKNIRSLNQKVTVLLKKITVERYF